MSCLFSIEKKYRGWIYHWYFENQHWVKNQCVNTLWTQKLSGALLYWSKKWPYMTSGVFHSNRLRFIPCCWPFPCFSGKYRYAVQKYFRYVGIFPCEFHSVSDCTLNKYSSVNDINDTYLSIMSCCWFEARFCHKLGKCFIYVRKHLDLC